MEIEVGTTYHSPTYPVQDIMVLGVASETDTELCLAVLFVDRATQTTTPGELKVLKSDLSNWVKVEY